MMYYNVCMNATSSINLDGWSELIKVNANPVAWVKGSAEEGMLVYSSVPFSRLYRYDVQNICHRVLDMLGRRHEILEGTMLREVVRYRKGTKKYFVVKNHGGMTENITIITHEKPMAFHLRKGDTFADKQSDGKYKLIINFKPREIRIIEYCKGT